MCDENSDFEDINYGKVKYDCHFNWKYRGAVDNQLWFEIFWWLQIYVNLAFQSYWWSFRKSQQEHVLAVRSFLNVKHLLLILWHFFFPVIRNMKLNSMKSQKKK